MPAATARPSISSEMNRTSASQALGTLYQLRFQTSARGDVPKAREELARAESEYRSAHGRVQGVW